MAQGGPAGYSPPLPHGAVCHLTLKELSISVAFIGACTIDRTTNAICRICLFMVFFFCTWYGSYKGFKAIINIEIKNE